MKLFVVALDKPFDHLTRGQVSRAINMGLDDALSPTIRVVEIEQVDLEAGLDVNQLNELRRSQ